MKKLKFKIGGLYKIRFHDHSVGMSDKMVCETVGWIIKDDDHHTVLTSWKVDHKDEGIVKANVEPSSIIKSCIIRSRKLI